MVEPQERVQVVVDHYGYSYPVLADVDHAVSSAYGIYDLLGDGRATPSIFIVDEKGTVIWVYVGQSANDRPSAQQMLNQLP